MVAEQVILEIPEAILKGLQNGTYERVGGVVREVASKQVVAWLRETGGLTLPNSIGNWIPGVDIINGILANIQLRQINLRLIDISNKLNTVLGLTQFNTALGLANLGLSAIGFAVVISKLDQIDSRIQHLQQSISELKDTIDRSLLAKAKSAINVAEIALKMSSQTNRKRLVTEVIQPLLEAEHYYQAAWDSNWNENNGILAREYILILSLVYVTEIKCYLELEEHEMALKRLAEAEEILKPRIRDYIKLLLTKNPSGYLHRTCQGVSLSSVVEILKYATGESDTNKLFDEYIRPAIFSAQDIESYLDSMPIRSRNAILALISPSLVGLDWTFWDRLPWNTAARRDVIFKLMSRVNQVIATAQSMIELDRRLEGYRYEVTEMTRLGLSYQEWQSLVLPPRSSPENPDSKVLLLLPA
ncbi:MULTISPECIES: hypothetical protein [unclassified Synechococcus]|uniref:hypothetical protein n=1 Tax=unclassified Synechococcus TaxID=2626047 RepID=UPI0039C005B3